jgi:HPt (histidine-containing phosphotransfer) domain-containing protein
MVTDRRKKLEILLIGPGKCSLAKLKTHTLPADWNLIKVNQSGKAIDLFCNKKFDLIFIEINLQDEGGFKTVENIRSLELKNNLTFTPIIAIISSEVGTEVTPQKKCQFSEFLLEPLSFNDILLSINRNTQEIEVKIDNEISELILGFVERRRSEIWELRNLIKSGELEKIAEIGHKLKGSAGTYGVFYLSEIGKRLEEYGLLDLTAEVLAAIIDYELYLSRLRLL